MSVKRKDPDGVLEYPVDWSGFLEGDTIATSTWIVPSGITKDSDDNTNTSTRIWLSGGAAGQVYVITNRITTVGGRTEDEIIEVYVNPSVHKTFSYNNDPLNIPLDFVRDRIGDTDASDPLLYDPEINSEIKSQPSLLWAAAACAKKIASRFARNVSAKVGNDSESSSDLFKHYSDMAVSLQMEARSTVTTAGVSVGKMKPVVQQRSASTAQRTEDIQLFEKL